MRFVLKIILAGILADDLILGSEFLYFITKMPNYYVAVHLLLYFMLAILLFIIALYPQCPKLHHPGFVYWGLVRP